MRLRAAVVAFALGIAAIGYAVRSEHASKLELSHVALPVCALLLWLTVHWLLERRAEQKRYVCPNCGLARCAGCGE